MAMVMIERPGGRITILNEPGSVLTAQGWQDYLAAVSEALPGHSALVCAGSLPPGAPLDAAGQLVELAHRAGIPALLDTAPPALRASLASGPDLVAPNLQEAEAALAGTGGEVLVDADADVRERAAEAARGCAPSARGLPRSRPARTAWPSPEAAGLTSGGSPPSRSRSSARWEPVTPSWRACCWLSTHFRRGPR
jgi:hypothetical protein